MTEGLGVCIVIFGGLSRFHKTKPARNAGHLFHIVALLDHGQMLEMRNELFFGFIIFLILFALQGWNDDRIFLMYLEWVTLTFYQRL